MNLFVKNFGGKEQRGIKFTMLSLEKFEEKIPFTKKPENAKIIYATFWAGLIGYTSAKDEDEDYTYEDVQEWVDQLFIENRIEDVEAVCTAWAEADMFKNRIKQVEDWAEKVRSLTVEEPEPNKKKAISTSNGLKLKNSPLVL